MINGKRILHVILWISAFFVLCVVFVRGYIVNESDDYIIATDDFARVGSCQDVIVLGAQVYDGDRMSGILRERAEAVIDLYIHGRACAILVSGNAQEVAAVKIFLIENNVDAKIILEDGDGFDTFASMKNARDKYGFAEALIVTQQFHMSRAIFIARSLGIDAKGYTAYKYPYPNKREKWRNYIREYPAAVKVIYEIFFKN